MTKAGAGKAFSIFIILLISVNFSFGQKTELNFNAYSGIFYFHGNGSTSNSWITAYTPAIPGNYTRNPYGKRSGFSYVFELQAQRISMTNNIYGLGIAFETLKSKVAIDTVNGGDLVYFQYAVNGKTILKNTLVTINPFVGHRYSYRKMNVDLLAGVDIGFCLRSKEVGQATNDNKDYIRIENIKEKPSIDFRPRIQLKAQLNNVGFLAGYSLGLTNYQTQTNRKAYSRFLRLGLSYNLQ